MDYIRDLGAVSEQWPIIRFSLDKREYERAARGIEGSMIAINQALDCSRTSSTPLPNSIKRSLPGLLRRLEALGLHLATGDLKEVYDAVEVVESRIGTLKYSVNSYIRTLFREEISTLEEYFKQNTEVELIL